MNPFNLEITDWAALDAQQRRALLRRPAGSDTRVQATVADIIRQVRAGGDTALADLTEQFDAMNSLPVEFHVRGLVDTVALGDFRSRQTGFAFGLQNHRPRSGWRH